MKEYYLHIRQGPGLILTGILLFASVAVSDAASGVYEPEPILKASEILTADLVSGEHHRVDERVRNDGFMNHYRLESDFGVFDVPSTALLKIRVREVQAIADLKALEDTDEFQDAIVESGREFGEGVKRLIDQPKETLEGAVSGVKRMFKRAGEAFHSKRSQSEDEVYKALIGFSATKREYAAEFRVDPYSTNEALQEQLETVAWAAYGGKISVTAAKMLIPGGIGLAVSAASSTQWMYDMVTQNPPTELRIINREKLAAMGVHSDVIDLFINNTVFSPTEQTFLVGSLEQMTETAGRDLFVKFAIPTSESELALFRSAMAGLYSGYHRRMEPVARFVAVESFIAAETRSGKFVVTVPVDHLVWTPLIEGVMETFDEYGKLARGKELWITGSASPMTRLELEGRGWVLHEQSGQQLLELRT